MGKSTPGPWVVVTVPTSVGTCHRVVPAGWENIDHGGICLYDDRTTLNPHPEGEQLANARLIAASPTMYEYVAKRAESGDGEAVSILEAIHAPR